jgi:hypothetical protein
MFMLAIAGALIGGAEAQTQTLSREPAMGALKPGQRVLVDDGSCPAGQIKEVIGGDHWKAGGKATVERQRRCVRRR